MGFTLPTSTTTKRFPAFTSQNVHWNFSNVPEETNKKTCILRELDC